MTSDDATPSAAPSAPATPSTAPSAPATPSAAPSAPATPSAAPSAIDRAFLTDLDQRPDATRVVLVRHGQQQWPDPATSTTGDWRDPPLSDTGRQQAAGVGRFLAHEDLDVVYSSHLARAHDTGAAIASHHRIEHRVIEDLREIEMFGELDPSVRPADVIGEQILTGARERFVRTRQWDAYPHTETSATFRRRCANAIEGIIAAHRGDHVAIACHGGVINCYLAELIGVEADMFFRPAHASCHRLVADGDDRAIWSLNETHYLAAVDPALVTY